MPQNGTTKRNGTHESDRSRNSLSTRESIKSRDSWGGTPRDSSPYKVKTQNQDKNFQNKLSFRRRCMPTPPVEELRRREALYRNDAILVEKRRTKYKDIIPPYDAKTDDFAKRYFKNPEVQKTIDITIDTPRGPRLTQMTYTDRGFESKGSSRK